jgi:hypothetical protein
MTEAEKKELQLIVLTLADPKGNWQYAWSQLCRLADVRAEDCAAPFKEHPLEQTQAEPVKNSPI